MKRASFLLIILMFILLCHPVNVLRAQSKIKPDIRASLIHVKTRPMPTQTCFGRTQEEWIRAYVGYNKITGNQIKFYSDLVPDADQLGGAMDRLLPYKFTTNNKTQMDETKNKPTWNAQICAYVEGGGVLSLPSNELITTEGEIPKGVKQQRWDWETFSAIVARGSIPLKNGVYDMQKPEVDPNTSQPLPCNTQPTGVTQVEKKDANQGENPFLSLAGWVEDAIVNAACAAPGNPCRCAMTKMVIEPDSTVHYAAPAACQAAGCKNEQGVQEEVLQVDPAVQPDEIAINSGGAVNAYRPAVMFPLFEYVKQVIGNVMGVQQKQSTTNNQNTQENDASWSFTKEWEVAADYLNCKVFPFNTRDLYDMPECNRNWLQNMVDKITYDIRADGPQTVPAAGSASQTPKP